MMHAIRTMFVISALAILCSALSGCGGNPAARLIGTWSVDIPATSNQPEPVRNIDEWTGRQFQFNADNTASITKDGATKQYAYLAGLPDDEGWASLELQADDGDQMSFAFNFDNSGNLQLRVGRLYIVVLTKQ